MNQQDQVTWTNGLRAKKKVFFGLLAAVPHHLQLLIVADARRVTRRIQPMLRRRSRGEIADVPKAKSAYIEEARGMLVPLQSQVLLPGLLCCWAAQGDLQDVLWLPQTVYSMDASGMRVAYLLWAGRSVVHDFSLDNPISPSLVERKIL